VEITIWAPAPFNILGSTNLDSLISTSKSHLVPIYIFTYYRYLESRKPSFSVTLDSCDSWMARFVRWNTVFKNQILSCQLDFYYITMTNKIEHSCTPDFILHPQMMTECTLHRSTWAVWLSEKTVPKHFAQFDKPIRIHLSVELLHIIAYIT
jgi:hypothetical protein